MAAERGEKETGSHARLSLAVLLAYAVPNISISVVHFPLNLYLTPLYSQGLGLSLTTVGLILFVTRLTDVFTDPLIGSLSDKQKSRFGRRKPWILAGIPVMLFAFWMLFAPPPGIEITIWYMFVFVAMVYVANTMIDLVYNAWGSELSKEYHERSKVTGMRESFGVLGTVSPCDAGHGTSCASCNAIARECGWCASAGRCMAGNELGPTSGTCATDWQWISPSRCPDTSTPMPSDPTPSDPTPSDPTPSDPTPSDPTPPMCLPMASSCAPGQCCSGLDCRRGVTFGVRCCGASGTMCRSGGDCCGYMDCVSGRCMCRSAGRRCLDDADCCSGTCSEGSCR